MNKANKLFLMRHGITENNMNKITQPQDGNVKLSELGKQCCEANVPEILETLQATGKPFIVLVSTAKRTMQTAKYITKHAAATYELPELLEVNFGDFAGKPADHVIDGKTMEDYRQMLIAGDVNHRYPNGESIEEIRNRVLTVMAKVAKLREQFTVVIVGHNRFFRHFELEYRNIMLGEYYYPGMFGNEFMHSSLYDIDASFAND
jgi:probable phosphoglycerate mutase